jgi:hypothetical protein
MQAKGASRAPRLQGKVDQQLLCRFQKRSPSLAFCSPPCCCSSTHFTASGCLQTCTQRLLLSCKRGTQMAQSEPSMISVRHTHGCGASTKCQSDSWHLSLLAGGTRSSCLYDIRRDVCSQSPLREYGHGPLTTWDNGHALSRISAFDAKSRRCITCLLIAVRPGLLFPPEAERFTICQQLTALAV